ncbi:hypothetical protein [Pantoea cypripedii]|uniref:Uncharacterized protein n=1 Tax=Pantoea cypripedii TaxID=55209 RepID=A0A6B9GB56_PANCY|nr:hypothetical protein [Pantoea cypripedii]QGY32550.1 hypothetical protein CUN67_26680 [Pantoea cypripedii]
MYTHNIKTATTESSKTWVENHFDTQLAVRTNAQVLLAKIEGDLMVLSAFDSLGIEIAEVDDIWATPRIAARHVACMIENGEIATPVIYALATSVQTLAQKVCCDAWKCGFEGLPPLEELRADALHQRDRIRNLIAESKRPFQIEVDGRMEYLEDDLWYGTFFRDSAITLGGADSIPEAMNRLRAIKARGNWPIREEGKDFFDPDLGIDAGPVSFQPHLAIIRDVAGRIVIRGNVRHLTWYKPATDPNEIAMIQIQQQALYEEAAFESGWDNYETARMLLETSDEVGARLVDEVWRGHPEVLAALIDFEEGRKQ